MLTAIAAAGCALMAPSFGCEGSVVVDGLQGPKTAGLQIRVQDSTAHFLIAPLDASGTAAFQGLACGPALVELGEELPSGFGHPIFRSLAATSAELASDFVVNISTPPLVRVSLVVQDVNGQPIPGKEVWLWTLDPQPRAFAFLPVGADGSIALVLVQGSYQIRSIADFDLAELKVNGVRASAQDPFRVESDPTALALVLGVHTILRGRVVDEAGVGQADAWVTVSGATDCARCASTDASGRFTMPVARLPVKVFVSGPAGLEADPHSIDIPSSEAASAELAFVLRPISGRILRGVVQETGGGPLADISVAVMAGCGDAGLLDQTVTSGATGQFRIELPAGCRLFLTIPCGRQQIFIPHLWQLISDEWQDIRTFEIRRGGIVTGVVRGVDGKPARELALEFSSKSDGWASRAVTDDDGAFRATLLPNGEFDVALGGPAAESPNRTLVLVDAHERPPTGARPSFSITDEEREAHLGLSLARGSQLCITAADSQGKEVLLPRLVVVPELAPAGAIADRTIRWSEREYAKELCSAPLIPGRYLVYVGRWGGPFAPVWWPGVAERAMAQSVLITKKEKQTIGPLIVTPAGNLICVVEGVTEKISSVSAELAAVADESEPPEKGWRTLGDDAIAIRNRGESDPVAVSVLSAPEGKWWIRLHLTLAADPERPVVTQPQVVTVPRAVWTTIKLQLAPPAPEKEEDESQPSAPPPPEESEQAPSTPS